MSGDKDSQIRKRAHLIWEREGRPEGRETEHWQMAAAELAAEGQAKPRGRRAAAAKPPVSPELMAPPAKPKRERAVAAKTAAPSRSRKPGKSE